MLNSNTWSNFTMCKQMNCNNSFIKLQTKHSLSIHIYSHVQTVSLYHNSSVRLDTDDAWSWDQNPPNFTLDLVSCCSATVWYTPAIIRHYVVTFVFLNLRRNNFCNKKILLNRFLYTSFILTQFYYFIKEDFTAIFITIKSIYVCSLNVCAL